MAVVPDLTIAEIVAEIDDTDLATWWTDAAPLPASVQTAEFFAKCLKAAHIAQQKKNLAAAPAVGEALNSYLAPITSNPVLDITSGLQTFTAQHTVRVVSPVNLDLAVPGR